MARSRRKARLRYGMGRAMKFSSFQLFDEIVQNGRFSEYGQRIIRKAYRIAQEAHRKQKPRGDGRPFIMHPLETAFIIMFELFILLPRAVALGLDHDTVEDCRRLRRHILQSFSPGYAGRIRNISRLGDKEKYHRTLLISGWVVILVKLADRLHNLRNILHMDEDFQIKQVVETYEYFFKLLDRLEQIIPSRYAYAPGYLRSEIRYAIRRIKRYLSKKGRRKLARQLKELAKRLIPQALYIIRKNHYALTSLYKGVYDLIYERRNTCRGDRIAALPLNESNQ